MTSIGGKAPTAADADCEPATADVATQSDRKTQMDLLSSSEKIGRAHV